MKRLFNIIILLTAFSSVLSARPSIKTIGCDKKAETSFMIITDAVTFSKCEAELYAYKNILEEEGLGTYIVYADWDSPESVKKQILKAAGKKPALEGIVLVGDVPIVMVREAQYMTTAFKMNEKLYPEFESSVPSDRFYDDFDLEFDFIKKDSLRNDVFYYRLSEKGSQVLSSDIYSARMKVPAVMKGDKYEILRKYLVKVVEAHKQQNILDKLVYFAGHGYNSDCLTVWRQKPVAFREYFPYAFDKASHNRFLNFRENDKMKENLFDALQREDTDLFIFSEHGDYDTQFINGNLPVHDFETNYKALQKSVASMYEDYKGTEDEEPFMKEVLDSVFKLPRSTVSDSLIARFNYEDSVEFADANISLEEIMKVRSNPRIIIFDACYNGSFHNEKGYVAGCHVFGDGKCVTAQGNTVNVLQDKWEDKLIGYLSLGMRAGMWQKEITYLESHMIGDPTFRFTSNNAADREKCNRLHRDLVFNAKSSQTWIDYLNSPDAILRAAGVTRLALLPGNWSGIIKDVYEKDDSWIVRLSALNAQMKYIDENAHKTISEAFKDSYEVVARTAARFAGASSDARYIEDLEWVRENRKDFKRVAFIATSSEKVLTPGSFASDIEKMTNKENSDKKRINAIRSFRNNRVPEAVAPLLAIVRDNNENEELRTVAAETLGWFRQSIQRVQISDELAASIETEKKMPSKVKKEIQKTIKRLGWE